MKINYLTKKFLFFLLMASSSTLNAQVTIGSDIPPKEGALLELKNNIDGSSTKGLGMPRVAIISLTDIKLSIPSVQVGEESQHAGLMVYNVNEDQCAPAPIFKGLYVWDGSVWQHLGNATFPDVQIYQDQDGNDFKARQFGAAGVWMVENLYVKNFAPGMGGAPIPLPTGTIVYSTIAYVYPKGTSSNWSAVPPTWDKSQGLLYTWATAAKGNTSAANQGQISGASPGVAEVENIGPLGSVPLKYVQGVCPDGWHLPSDREWNELEKEIYNKANIYSTSSSSEFSPTTWVSSWETTPDDRGSSSTHGHANAMMVQCRLAGSGIGNPAGTSRPAAQGGFSATLPGGIFASSAQNYGYYNYLWSSSSAGNSESAWSRDIHVNKATVARKNSSRNSMYSVRCKKNQ